uniref:Uncharacterized protein n=1 Tax=Anguilla anguilla TaxID=7936 RepID=A0A0E9UPN8_ANGAN
MIVKCLKGSCRSFKTRCLLNALLTMMACSSTRTSRSFLLLGYGV